MVEDFDSMKSNYNIIMKLVILQPEKINCFKGEDIRTHKGLIRQDNKFNKTNNFSKIGQCY